MDQYINEKELSKITGLAVRTLRNYRFQNRGFPYCKIGKAVRYRLEDIVKFMDSRKVETSDSIGKFSES